MPMINRIRSFISKPIIIKQKTPVIIDNTDYCTEPIFLIGVHRSGTSLVRRMFNAHPNISCPPETFFLKHYCDLFDDPLTADGLRGFGQSAAGVRQLIARQASIHHEALRIAEQKKRWADKTPQYVDILPKLNRLFAPGARFVMIFRDPRDIAFSIFERGWRFSNFSDNPLKNTALYVTTQTEKMRSFMNANTDICTYLRYDKLIEDPYSELSRVTSFLGENFTHDMINFNDKQHNFGTEDPIVRGKSKLVISKDRWKSLGLEDKRMISDILQKDVLFYKKMCDD